MSASRDQSQKHIFVYTNFYSNYVKEKNESVRAAAPQTNTHVVRAKAEPAVSAPLEQQHTQGLTRVIRSTDPEAAEAEPFRPTEFIAHRVAASKDRWALEPALSQAQSLESLKKNLSSMQDLHARLRFLLKEIEKLGS